VAAPSSMMKQELDLKTQKATGFLLRSRLAQPYLERDFPRLRIGDGIDLGAVREIAVRSHTKVTRRKPIFLMIRGQGHAVYSDAESGRRLERDTITLLTEVIASGDGYRVQHRVF
jgi:hypothetical protein